VIGGAGNDTITGSDGENSLEGLSGADSLSGAGGADTVDGGIGNDVLDGGEGIDTALFDASVIIAVDLRLETVQDTGMGLDILVGIENLIGGSAGDRLIGNAGANALIGNAGSDLLIGDGGDDLIGGGAGNDRLEGADGIDTAVFSGSRANYLVEAHADGTVTVSDLRPGGDGQDTLTGLEQLRFSDMALAAPTYAPPSDPSVPPSSPGPVSVTLVGTAARDSLAAGAGNDRITGLSGNDVLIGLGGDDMLRGGRGKDVLSGGDGRDAFIFDAKIAKKNADRIADFTVGADAVWLENALFKSNKTLYRAIKKGKEAHPLHMSKKFVAMGHHAKDGNDYFILDRKKGVLSYDADGSGAHKAIEIATFKKGLKMSYHDLFFV
jgi:Ca2+-binding RTX toxin-like protein